jgi:Zn-dependent protease
MHPVLAKRLAALARARLKLGRIEGVLVSIHWTWFPFLAWFAWKFAARYSSWIWAAVEIVALFILVLLHEIGHALALRKFGAKAVEVILWPLGGFTLPVNPQTWRREALIFGAGPAVNLALAPFLFITWYEFGYHQAGNISQLLWRLSLQNGSLLLFNLLPIWPLDGGRLADALLRAKIGSARSKFVTSMSGLVCSSIGCVLSVYFREFGVAAFFVAFLVVNTAILEWSINLLRREKRFGVHATAACPHCGTQAMSEDWNYGLDVGPIPCQYCFETTEGTDWVSIRKSA